MRNRMYEIMDMIDQVGEIFVVVVAVGCMASGIFAAWIVSWTIGIPWRIKERRQ